MHACNNNTREMHLNSVFPVERHINQDFIQTNRVLNLIRFWTGPSGVLPEISKETYEKRSKSQISRFQVFGDKIYTMIYVCIFLKK